MPRVMNERGINATFCRGAIGAIFSRTLKEKVEEEGKEGKGRRGECLLRLCFLFYGILSPSPRPMHTSSLWFFFSFICSSPYNHLHLIAYFSRHTLCSSTLLYLIIILLNMPLYCPPFPIRPATFTGDKLDKVFRQGPFTNFHKISCECPKYFWKDTFLKGFFLT